jgi:hypothetical protein
MKKLTVFLSLIFTLLLLSPGFTVYADQKWGSGLAI